MGEWVGAAPVRGQPGMIIVAQESTPPLALCATTMNAAAIESIAASAVVTGVTTLPELGVIRAVGEDAAKFLHGQLTNDFSLLGLSEARLAAFCSAKGRMLASFIGFKRTHQEVLLVCHRSVLPATLKRLQMFVLRAKVQLSDASEAFALRGLTLAAPLPAWSKTDGADGSHTIGLYPANGQARALWVAPAEVVAPDAPALPPGQWDWLEVMAGIATVSLPIAETFVPQMLNYESVGGVNFKKGCYPGQEVVARSQFRGTLKRRAYLVQSPESLTVGQDVFHSSDAEQPCGTVASAAAHPAGGWNAIVSLQTSATADGSLNAGSPQGPMLALLPLPYPLRDDI